MLPYFCIRNSRNLPIVHLVFTIKFFEMFKFFQEKLILQVAVR